MKTSTDQPVVTAKWPIEVPVHTYGSGPAVFRIMFGTKYLVWKGKSMLQSCQLIAEQLERYLRLKKDEETDQLYHVANHVRRTRCLKATVEVIANEFQGPNFDRPVDGYKMLKTEQEALERASKDPNCLNNNAWAYEPKWITEVHKAKYHAWLKRRAK